MKFNISVYNTYRDEYEVITVGLWDIVKVLIGFPVKIGKRQYEKWTGPTDFYMFYCGRVGFTIDYRHGYDERLDCPQV